MNHRDKYNSEGYLDMTPYLAMNHIEQAERKEQGIRDDRVFRCGDIYIADLGKGSSDFDGSHVQYGIRPVVVVQNDIGNFFSTTLIVVPITSNIRKKPFQPTHCLVRKTEGLHCDGIALAEQITTIDKFRCLRRLGKLGEKETEAVQDAVLRAIGAGGKIFH